MNLPFILFLLGIVGAALVYRRMAAILESQRYTGIKPQQQWMLAFVVNPGYLTEDEVIQIKAIPDVDRSLEVARQKSAEEERKVWYGIVHDCMQIKQKKDLQEHIAAAWER